MTATQAAMSGLGTSGLAVRDLAIRYGGLQAVSGVSLDAPVGRITGLIGPNGAGKTSSFNALSGLLRPSAGSVHIDGQDVTRLSPVRRARAGLGRTFQRMELCNGLTVRENVALGREARLAGSAPLHHLLSPRQEAAAMDAAVDEALARCGLERIASRRVGGIPTGQKRLVELARVIAGGFHVLLLDEPSSGLDTNETRRFGEILKELRHSSEVAILIVEHDMALVMDICDYIFVIDFGQPIFDGTPSEVATSEKVRTAYLGTEQGAGA
jgi:ABC-type branched-subunit amino acid transport system ATPase component